MNRFYSRRGHTNCVRLVRRWRYCTADSDGTLMTSALEPGNPRGPHNSCAIGNRVFLSLDGLVLVLSGCPDLAARALAHVYLPEFPSNWLLTRRAMAARLLGGVITLALIQVIVAGSPHRKPRDVGTRKLCSSCVSSNSTNSNSVRKSHPGGRIGAIPIGKFILIQYCFVALIASQPRCFTARN